MPQSVWKEAHLSDAELVSSAQEFDISRAAEEGSAQAIKAERERL